MLVHRVTSEETADKSSLLSGQGREYDGEQDVFRRSIFLLAVNTGYVLRLLYV
jgi:hypothetical protein